MKKRSVITIMALCLTIITGCSATKEISTTKSNVNSYTYSGDTRFMAVSYEHIDDGAIKGLDIIVYVDKYTKVQYLYTEKYISGAGFASTFTQLVDSKGNPILYDGVLE